VARVVGHEPVVGGVVDAAEREHRTEVVALGGVVVDDVEDHLDAREVQRLDHALELAHLLAADAGRGVERVRREEADRRVAPVVRQPAVDEEGLVGDVVNGQQLDGRDAERLQVLERGRVGEPRVGAAQVLAHVRVELREALDVHLVDDQLVQRDVGAAVALPVEAGVDHHALGDRGRVVLVVELEVGLLDRPAVGRHVGQHVGLAPAHRPLDRLGVGIEQQLARVEAVARPGVVGAVHAVAVALAGADARQVAVPVVRRVLDDLDARLVVVGVEQAELDALGVLGEQREVRPLPVPGGAERERLAGPDVHPSSAPLSGGRTT
jgi:hypothetical protein